MPGNNYDIAHRPDKQKLYSTAEIAALEDHSLVIDKRCLDFNYWPDTVPACFQECEEND